MIKKLLIILIALALLGGEAGAATFPRLRTYDCLPSMTITSYGPDGYLYGWNSASATTVKRILPDSGVTMESMQDITEVDSDYTGLRRVDTTNVSGTVLATVYKANNEYDLLRSTNGGTSFEKVFDFGAGNGAEGVDTPYVYLLGPIAVMSRDYPGGGGTGDLLLAEYNVNASRTTGSTNDRVRLMRSTNDGATWSKIAEWNTDSSNQFGHIHKVKQDPYTGYVYILTGDADNKASIIRWDGVTAFTADNATPATIGGWSGFKSITGGQNHRSVDILFTASYAFTFSDAYAAAAEIKGIWRWNKDLSSGAQVDSQIATYEAMMSGWYGLEVGDKLIFTTCLEASDELPCTTPHLPYFVSEDGGATWNMTAYSNGNTSDLTISQYPRAFINVADKMYRPGSAATDAGYWGTDVLYFDGTTSSAETTHPVYWVGTWSAAGNDSNTGKSRWLPKATLSNTLSSNRITGGSLVRVSGEIITDNTQVYPEWNNNTYPCADKGVTIEGEGRDTTIYKRTSASYLIALDTTKIYDYPVVIKDMSLQSYGATTSSTNVLLYAGTPDVEIYDSYLYSLTAPALTASAAGSTLKSYRSMFKTTATNVNVITPTAAFSQQHEYSIIVGGNYGIVHRYASSLCSIKNSDIYGFAINGVQMYSGVDSVPTVKNCIIYGGTGSTYGINDASGQTEDGTTILNNTFYNCTATHTIANVSATNKTQDPKFIALGTDFRLSGSSPCRNTGLNSLWSGTASVTDYAGTPITNAAGTIIAPGGTVDIGAYEYRPSINNAARFMLLFD